MLIEGRREQVIRLCQALVQIESYSGHEFSVVERMKQAFHDWEFDEVLVDSYGSVLGCIHI